MIRIRSIERRDIEFCRKLRNDNRKACFYQELISKKEQEEWYERYLNSSDRLFVIEKVFFGFPIRVGSVGYKEQVDLIDIFNVIILSHWRGRGIMKKALGMMCKIAPKGRPFGVFVLRWNYNAYVWYLKNGFYKVADSDNYYLLHWGGPQ